MTTGCPRAILLDFFGTLVRYESTWTALAYAETHALLTDWGSSIAYDSFVAEWESAYQLCEAHSVATHEEHAGTQVVDEFLRRTGIDLDRTRRADLLATYLDEWSVGVQPIDQVDELLDRLAGSHRLGIVSNTHNGNLVPELLERFGLADRVELVLLSVDHGYRKPHPSIYQAALDHFGCASDQALFVGDSLEPDYLGPRRHGIPALLIDPTETHPIEPGDRLNTVLDLGAHLEDLRAQMP